MSPVSAQVRKAPPLRESIKVPVKEFHNAAAALGTTPKRLAKEIGYSETASYAWDATGMAPKVAVVAAQGLVAATAALASPASPPSAASHEVVMLIRVGSDRQREMLCMLAKGMGLEFVVV